VLLSRLAGHPHGSSQSEILAELRRCILDGEVPPGSPIPVDGVAASFGVSRIPVREALETAALRAAVALAGADDDDQARAAHAALEAAVVAGDSRAHHRESRRFHLALIRPCRMRRLLHMLGTAWNMTEPLQPMSHLDANERALLHQDHAGMLAAFTARDTEQLITVCAAHHQRLQTCIATLPQDRGLFAD
jgi:DNA-binding GntR family transcriptional regulator